MITDFIVDVGTAIVVWFTTLFPPFTMPDWFANIGTTLNGFLQALSGMGVWVNWVIVAACVTAVLGSWIVFAQMKLVRVAAGHIPEFGGNG